MFSWSMTAGQTSESYRRKVTLSAVKSRRNFNQRPWLIHDRLGHIARLFSGSTHLICTLQPYFSKVYISCTYNDTRIKVDISSLWRSCIVRHPLAAKKPNYVSRSFFSWLLRDATMRWSRAPSYKMLSQSLKNKHSIEVSMRNFSLFPGCVMCVAIRRCRKWVLWLG